MMLMGWNEGRENLGKTRKVAKPPAGIVAFSSAWL
jgi:hypothetical protein